MEKQAILVVKINFNQPRKFIAHSAVWCTFQIFLGVSGSEDRGGGDNSIQFIDIGRVGDKSFKEWRQKIGGGRVGDNNILTFLYYWLDKKNATLKNCILGNFFYSYL